MEKILDQVHEYRGFHGFPSRCWVQAWKGRAEGLSGALSSYGVVLVSELPDNPGTSVTNMAEDLADQIYHLIGCPDYCAFFEHYPEGELYAFRDKIRRFRAEIDRILFRVGELETWNAGASKGSSRSADRPQTRPRLFHDPVWRPSSLEEVERLAEGPVRVTFDPLPGLNSDPVESAT